MAVRRPRLLRLLRLRLLLLRRLHLRQRQPRLRQFPALPLLHPVVPLRRLPQRRHPPHLRPVYSLHPPPHPHPLLPPPPPHPLLPPPPPHPLLPPPHPLPPRLHPPLLPRLQQRRPLTSRPACSSRPVMTSASADLSLREPLRSMCSSGPSDLRDGAIPNRWLIRSSNCTVQAGLSRSSTITGETTQEQEIIEPPAFRRPMISNQRSSRRCLPEVIPAIVRGNGHHHRRRLDRSLRS